jgi:hypothetical protein
MIVHCPELRKIVNNGLPNVYLTRALFTQKVQDFRARDPRAGSR